MNRFSKVALSGLLVLAGVLSAGEMPFPQVENGKVRLLAKDSPYILEQGVVVRLERHGYV